MVLVLIDWWRALMSVLKRFVTALTNTDRVPKTTPVNYYPVCQDKESNTQKMNKAAHKFYNE